MSRSSEPVPATDDLTVVTDAAEAASLAGRLFPEVLRRTHLSRAADLPGLLAEEAEAVGWADLVLHIVDHEQNHLVELARDAQPVRRIPVDGTDQGRCFTTLSIIELETGSDERRRLILPLLDGTERLGTIELTVPASERAVPAAVVTIAERFAHLCASAVVTKSMYGDAFELARRAQSMDVSAELVRSLLPPTVFATRDLAIAAVLEPAYSVGGDAFDYAVNGDIAHIAIFDAMGHGLEAAGEASFAVAAYRRARREGMDLAETYTYMDGAIRDQPAERYVTGILAELDVATGSLRWLSAGHPPPLLVRDGRAAEMRVSPNIPFGLTLPRRDPVVVEDALRAGDQILLYTDGLPEARTTDGALFTVERLGDFLVREAAEGFPAPETLRRMRNAVLTHPDVALHDDATGVLIEWRGPSVERMVPATVL